jgi:hypothetical protein
MRSSAFLAAIVLLAGCASSPDEALVWSAGLARSLARETGDVIEVAQFSRWQPYLVLRGNAPTVYRVVERDGMTVLEADAEEGGSGLYRKIRIDPSRHPILEWRWQVPAEPDTRVEVSSRASPLLRLSLAFHGDPGRLDFEDRAKLRLAKVLTVNGLPYASLLYVWMYAAPVDTVLHSPHTDRVRMIVVESGVQRIGEWVTIRRNVLEDYRRAFGEEPDDIVAVGLMTDPGDDGSRRRSFYGDITFRSGK